MDNITITNIDRGGVVLRDAEFQDGELTFAGAGTVLEGTILARDSSTKKFVPFVAGGSTNENGIPKAVITYTVAATGAGNIPVRVLVSGVVNRNRLVIHGDGDGSNVTDAVADQLRDYGIVAQKVSQLGRYDNPQGEDEES